MYSLHSIRERERAESSLFVLKSGLGMTNVPSGNPQSKDNDSGRKDRLAWSKKAEEK